MSAAHDYLERLHDRARTAGSSETEFRREAARRTQQLERERTFAFRRYNLVKDVLTAMRPHGDERAALAAAGAHLRERFGWSAADEARHKPVLDAFAPVASALYRAGLPEPELSCDPAAVLAEFERWFEGRSGRSFFSLLDEPATVSPLVDF